MQVKNIVTTSIYQKDGIEKKRYTNIGTAFIYDDGGISIKLDTIPLQWDGKATLYDQQQKEQS